MNKIKKIVGNYHFHRNYDTDKSLYDKIWYEAQLELLKEIDIKLPNSDNVNDLWDWWKKKHRELKKLSLDTKEDNK